MPTVSLIILGDFMPGVTVCAIATWAVISFAAASLLKAKPSRHNNLLLKQRRKRLRQHRVAGLYAGIVFGQFDETVGAGHGRQHP